MGFSWVRESRVFNIYIRWRCPAMGWAFNDGPAFSAHPRTTAELEFGPSLRSVVPSVEGPAVGRPGAELEL
jgi:hypothetical protein